MGSKSYVTRTDDSTGDKVLTYQTSASEEIQAVIIVDDEGDERYAGEVIEETLSLDTNVYADGDVLADTQELTDAMTQNGGTAILVSVTILDKDDQKQAMDLVFLRDNVSLGSENSAPDIDDTEAEDVLGIVEIEAGDFYDLGGCAVATITDINLMLCSASDAKHLYLAAISRGTGTYTASGVIVKLGIRRQ